MFPSRSQVSLPRPASNNNPLLLESNRSGGPISFKFEMWFQLEDFLEVLEHEWNRVNYSGYPSRNFKALNSRLKAWNKDNGEAFKVNKDKWLARIKVLDEAEEGKSLSRDERIDRDSLRRDFQLLVCKEKIYQKQQSCIKLLKQGDKNSNFFHNMVFAKMISNSIQGLQINGVWF